MRPIHKKARARTARQFDALKILCVLAISLMLLYAERTNRLSIADSAVQWLTLPLQYGTYPIARLKRQWRNLGDDRASLRARLDRLEKENVLLSAHLLDRTALAQDNAHLRGLLGAQIAFSATTLKIGEVIRTELLNPQERLMINLGAEQGVRLGQLVLDDAGVIGQIGRVRLTSAEVVLITDPSVRISVMNERTGERSLSEGAISHLNLLKSYGATSSNMGDVWVTSGLAPQIPRGFPVGRVVDIREEQRLYSVALAPSARLYQAAFVLVLMEKTNRPTVGPPDIQPPRTSSP